MEDYIRSSTFTVSRDKTCLIGELSEIPHGAWHDGGILWVKSSKTERMSKWQESGKEYDREGCLVKITMIPTKETIEEMPELFCWELVLFND